MIGIQADLTKQRGACVGRRDAAFEELRKTQSSGTRKRRLWGKFRRLRSVRETLAENFDDQFSRLAKTRAKAQG
jgi:hypothetical protein